MKDFAVSRRRTCFPVARPRPQDRGLRVSRYCTLVANAGLRGSLSARAPVSKR